jgi:hypothetical protein
MTLAPSANQDRTWEEVSVSVFSWRIIGFFHSAMLLTGLGHGDSSNGEPIASWHESVDCSTSSAITHDA